MGDESDVNIAEVVAQVTEAFAGYERALVNRDLHALGQYFGSRADLVRFGVADRQKGPEELATWRANQAPLPPNRTLRDTVVTTFGHSYAVVSTLFYYPERSSLGRQSQVWVHGDTDWKIVHAHVSEIANSPEVQMDFDDR